LFKKLSFSGGGYQRNGIAVRKPLKRRAATCRRHCLRLQIKHPRIASRPGAKEYIHSRYSRGTSDVRGLLSGGPSRNCVHSCAA
jgi:hypothetical protein